MCAETNFDQPKSEEEVIAEFKESKYWNENMPGHEGWTWGDLVLQLMQVGEWKSGDTLEGLVGIVEKAEK